MDEKESGELVKFFFEVGQANLVKISGWWTAKVKDPNSVAEHSFRSALIAFVLAKLEGRRNPFEIAFAALAHDLPETRILDRHKISQAYFKTPKEVELKVIREQCSRLPKGFSEEVFEMLAGILEGEKAIINDASYLEHAFQAKEYFDIGYKDAWDFILRIEKVLRTGTAKILLKKLKKTDSNVWWQGLKQKITELKY
jgi:putative hydrolase of HD superfamily